VVVAVAAAVITVAATAAETLTVGIPVAGILVAETPVAETPARPQRYRWAHLPVTTPLTPRNRV
ncbi:hypothetical protein, partial [Rahnella sp. CG8]|uniref:hypothetical protein n=1 Tax=Rahnella sp. CG8 TaxID=2726078 RepID=UPI00203426FB